MALAVAHPSAVASVFAAWPPRLRLALLERHPVAKRVNVDGLFGRLDRAVGGGGSGCGRARGVAPSARRDCPAGGLGEA